MGNELMFISNGDNNDDYVSRCQKTGDQLTIVILCNNTRQNTDGSRRQQGAVDVKVPYLTNESQQTSTANVTCQTTEK